MIVRQQITIGSGLDVDVTFDWDMGNEDESEGEGGHVSIESVIVNGADITDELSDESLDNLCNRFERPEV